MLSLEAVLRHPALRGMRCVAGQSGLARNVANVAFLDYEPTQGSYANFYKDELVLSTMLFAQGQPALAWQAMEGLMRRGVTAIAVKTVFLHEFPPHVCAMAQQTGTALLLYDGVYLEDVIAAVKGMLGQSVAFEKKDKLAARLAREQQPARCERLAQRLLAPRRFRCSARRVLFLAMPRPGHGWTRRPAGRQPAAGLCSAWVACWCCFVPRGARIHRRHAPVPCRRGSGNGGEAGLPCAAGNCRRAWAGAGRAEAGPDRGRRHHSV